MEYHGTQYFAELWGYSKATIARWCREGLIEGAVQDRPGSPWRIPANAKCPKKVRRKQ